MYRWTLDVSMNFLLYYVVLRRNCFLDRLFMKDSVICYISIGQSLGGEV